MYHTACDVYLTAVFVSRRTWMNCSSTSSLPRATGKRRPTRRLDWNTMERWRKTRLAKWSPKRVRPNCSTVRRIRTRRTRTILTRQVAPSIRPLERTKTLSSDPRQKASRIWKRLLRPRPPTFKLWRRGRSARSAIRFPTRPPAAKPRSCWNSRTWTIYFTTVRLLRSWCARPPRQPPASSSSGGQAAIQAGGKGLGNDAAKKLVASVPPSEPSDLDSDGGDSVHSLPVQPSAPLFPPPPPPLYHQPPPSSSISYADIIRSDHSKSDVVFLAESSQPLDVKQPCATTGPAPLTDLVAPAATSSAAANVPCNRTAPRSTLSGIKLLIVLVLYLHLVILLWQEFLCGERPHCHPPRPASRRHLLSLWDRVPAPRWTWLLGSSWTSSCWPCRYSRPLRLSHRGQLNRVFSLRRNRMPNP